MFIIIKDQQFINKIVLEDKYSYKGIEIYSKNNQYYINLKDDYYFSNNTKISLLECRYYKILNNNLYFSIDLYVYQNNNGIDEFKLYNNEPLLISSNPKSNVVCNDVYLKYNYLYLNEGCIKTNFDVVVNGLTYDNNQICDGDIIEYLGIKIIYFTDYLYINNFNIINRMNEYEGHEAIIRYKDLNNIPNYYIPSELFELEIDPIDKFVAPKKANLNEFIKSLIPNLIMSFSMAGLACVSYYSSIINNQPEYTRISYILMPISMFVTGIIVPIAFRIYDKHTYKVTYNNDKSTYLSYLKDYEDKLEKDIKSYLNSYNDLYFDLANIKDKMFYANKDSKQYMSISLGKMIIARSLTYKLSQDKDIDDYLLKIKNRLNYIEDFPLFLNIKDNKIITIVSKRSDKLYFFNKFLLELAYKHHYDDLSIGVYCKDNSIFDSIFNLPHLFIDNNRITINTERGLIDLDQRKLNRPLILFLYDYANYCFSNPNIYIIYLSTDIKDLYKNSSCIVEYLNNKAYLYKDCKIEFSYIRNDINFKDYYSYLGSLKSINNKFNNYRFSDTLSLDIKNNYMNNNHTLSASFSYSNNELLSFDLHESKQGPHGLIGGCTGSGKSELIVSLLLSLCISYAPDYLNIVLIDYKGGGIKESLSYDNVSLPHIVASISNLENNSIERLIICLNNECKYRQELFKRLSSRTNTSIMNLDDYLSGDYSSYHLNKLAHLLIVVDEFAELKKENPEVIKELVSLSRIGRSLGLHLILATQKPSGVIDEEIWSNSHFKIALKVFEEKDSQDLIKKIDAAYLNNAGSFLLQVDDSLIKAQSIYAKADINGNEPYKVSLLNNTLDCVKSYKYQASNQVSECSVYAKKIIDACDELNIKPRILDFLPALSKYRKDLCDKECLVFGESDDYLNTCRNPVTYGLKDNVLIVSCRQNEINSYLNTFNEFKRNCIVISNKKYMGTYISDCLNYDDNEDIDYLLNYLLSHKNLNLTLVVEDLNCLLSYDESYLDKLCKLARRSSTLNLSLLFISSNAQLSFKLINYFKNRVLININDKSDLSVIYGARSRYEGHSYYYEEEPISMIPILLENYNECESVLKPIVKRIPDAIEPMFEAGLYLMGYDILSKEKIMSNNNLIILANDESLLTKYKKAYKDIDVSLYSHKLKVDNNTNILWLGPGIFNQRLFVASNNRDLNQAEGLFISHGNKTLIRSLNYV